MMKYEQTDEFGRDLKRLSKKFPSLEGDLETAKKNAIELRYERNMDNGAVFEISGCCSETVKVAKVKKFACKSLRGTGVRSGIRLIIAYYPGESRVVFIEIYYKGEKENEDRDRIKEHLAS